MSKTKDKIIDDLNNIGLNKLCEQAYKIACEHGFHEKELSNEHWLCLVISELMEAVEADRKEKNFDFSNNDFDHFCRTSDRCGFLKAFEDHVKDTVSDELADAAIRLLDLYGLRKIELNEDLFNEETIAEYAKEFENNSFTEAIYSITGKIASRCYSVDQSAIVPEMLLLEIFGLAKHLDIDLLWHIKQKMEYNKARERMHGIERMRTIKFRGKDVNTGEWAYGSLIKFDIGYVILTNEKTERNSTLGVDNCIVFSEKEIAVVFPRTIGQSTGLLDKNGKEIYEGDVITVNGKYPKLIKYIDEYACFCMANIVDLDEHIDTGYWHQVSPGWWNCHTREIKVVGNIHDNPELLKGGKP